MNDKTLKIIIKDRSEDLVRIRFLRPSGIQKDTEVQTDSLREATIETFHRWLAAGKITSPDELILLGRHLYQVLFNDDLTEAFGEELNRIKQETSAILRLVLEFKPDAHKLAIMPWEYLYFPDTFKWGKGFFIAADPWSRLILARHVPVQIPEITATPRPLKILIVLSQAEGEDLTEVKADPLIKTIKKLKKDLPGAIEMDLLSQPTKRSLTNKVMDFQPHVVHFIGHGQYKQDKGFLGLVQEKDSKTVAWISDTDLADCFRAALPPPRLIFLHACEGAYSESYEAFRGIALQLVYSDVPAVVAMQYKVENHVANLFATKFYQSLGEGKRIDEAVQAGRKELGTYLTEENFSSRAFGSPVVYIQRADGIIIAEAQPDLEQDEPKGGHELSMELVLCPNRKCSGKVLPTDKKCAECRHELMPCPDCQKVMSKTSGVCVACGYEKKAEGAARKEAEAAQREAEPLQKPAVGPQRPRA